ncbi:hypothetical protein Xen7305DRAFT_00040190 [Xenococcus sp. PCC 7305]|uniref:MarR family transcriptional regulator n=1 Tax=Xenococcus sp. PCC 7305 TaxID=102125 RepID=UPI0002ABC3C5|nr:helix-turn-helix domain-containing protein [Xenococcus sp. PCC 7305]ELS04290.1 hypothetical protein Xen7305DRAFT_00040190 [Xenococcus sp. PCC 7305]
MNTAALTGVKKSLFLMVAQHPGITKKDLCAYSFYRGGKLSRINHHLKGLENRGYILSFLEGKKSKYHYMIAKDKGEKMLETLRN